MKSALLILALVLVGCSGYNYITSEQAYQQEIRETTLTQKEAYNAALEWMAKNFVSSQKVIQHKNEETGIIIGQAKGTYYYDILNTQIAYYDYTLTITTRDNKVKFEFLINPPYIYEKDLPQITVDNISTIESMMGYFNNYGNDDF